MTCLWTGKMIFLLSMLICILYQTTFLYLACSNLYEVNCKLFNVTYFIVLLSLVADSAKKNLMHFPIVLHPVAEPNAPTYCLDIEYIKCLTHIRSASRLCFYIFTKKFLNPLLSSGLFFNLVPLFDHFLLRNLFPVMNTWPPIQVR